MWDVVSERMTSSSSNRTAKQIIVLGIPRCYKATRKPVNWVNAMKFVRISGRCVSNCVQLLTSPRSVDSYFHIQIWHSCFNVNLFSSSFVLIITRQIIKLCCKLIRALTGAQTKMKQDFSQQCNLWPRWNPKVPSTLKVNYHRPKWTTNKHFSFSL